MRIAIAQTDILYEQYEKNKDAAVSMVQQARAQKARLVLFPEMSFTGFSMRIAEDIAAGQDTLTWIPELASANRIYIGFGWVADAGTGKAENHYSIIAPDGNMVLDYVKIHPFSYAGEDLVFEKGNHLAICEIDDFRIGCFICYDLRFPQVFSAVAAETDCIIVPANWPKRRRHHWNALLAARAIENQLYVVGVNCVGRQGQHRYSGDSRVIAPTGEKLLNCGKAVGCYFCEIEKKSVLEIRRTFPVYADRRPNLYAKFQ